MTAVDLDPQAEMDPTPLVDAPAGRPSATTITQAGDGDHSTSGGVVAPSDPQATADSLSTSHPLAGPSSDQPAERHTTPDEASLAGRSPTSRPTIAASTPKHPSSGGDTLVEPATAIEDALSLTAPPGGFDELRILAESYQDAQDVRIRIENRLRSGTIPPDLANSILTEQLRVEKMIGTAMRKQFRRCAPDIHAWAKATVGIGEHLMARLIGTIGHPVIATPHHWEETGHSNVDTHAALAGPSRVLVADPPFIRNVAKLWAYCGHGDPTRRKAKGMTADQALALGSPRAKMLVHLLAESAMKCVGSGPTTDQSSSDIHRTVVRRRSPYRDTYEAARLRYADRDGWTPGHQHNAALRLVGKEILRDLWRAAQPTKSVATPSQASTVGLLDQNQKT